MNKPSPFRAAGVSAALSLLFVTVYGTCSWITSLRSDVGTWCYAWERRIPLAPLMIVPYLSIDLFFVAAPFLCQTRGELRALARRTTFAIGVAGCFFLLIPLQMGAPRPQPAGWSSVLFKFLQGFDRPYNLFPSLHVTLCAILAPLYVRRSPRGARWATQIWFGLIGLSTLLTYQHHVVDVAGGLALAAVCFCLIREQSVPLPVIPHIKIGIYYAAGALVAAAIAALAWPWTALFVWPAVSLTAIAVGYWCLGPSVYGKSHGRLSWIANLLLAPCLAGQHLSRLYYRRQGEAWNPVTPNLWIGAKLNSREALELKRRGVTAVLDLTAEFSEEPIFLALCYRNLPVLDLTGLSPLQIRESAAFLLEQSAAGIVYVHCKAGYSRAAAAVGAYLLKTGQAPTVEMAVKQLRAARPSIIIRPETFAALSRFKADLDRDKGEDEGGRQIWGNPLIKSGPDLKGGEGKSVGAQCSWVVHSL